MKHTSIMLDDLSAIRRRNSIFLHGQIPEYIIIADSGGAKNLFWKYSLAAPCRLMNAPSHQDPLACYYVITVKMLSSRFSSFVCLHLPISRPVASNDSITVLFIYIHEVPSINETQTNHPRPFSPLDSPPVHSSLDSGMASGCLFQRRSYRVA
jgi:hypothetical protein